ncbi:MAG: hypothetical protein AAF620_13950 [Bacteroidota bacterium]
MEICRIGTYSISADLSQSIGRTIKTIAKYKLRKMRFYNLINKKQAWASMLLLGVIFVGIFSCSTDDSTDIATEEAEAESAYFQYYRNETPGGSVIYINVNENIPEVADLSTSVELGIEVVAIPFGENIYTIDGNASTVTKWQVDRSSLGLSVTDLFSIASTGVVSSIGFGEYTTRTIVFASDTQAFIANLLEGSILEWNPTTMEIVKTHKVDPVVPAGDDYYIDIFRGLALEGGKVAWSLDHYPPETCCDLNFAESLPILAVLDPATGDFSYKYDDRMPYGGLATTFADGNAYMSSSRYVGMTNNYFDTDKESDHYMLKIDSDGNFDPSFEFNISAVADIGWGGQVLTLQGNEILVDYHAISEWPEAFDDRWNWWGTTGINEVKVINIETNQTRDFTGFADYNGGFWPWGVLEGANYYAGYNYEDGDTKADLLKQNSFDDIVVVTTAPDGIFIEGIARLW